MLVSGPSDLPPRQQTLRATIDWSHDLLGPDEQQLFRRLAVFFGGFTAEAAGIVDARPSASGETGDFAVLAGLAVLVDKNLLRIQENPADAREPRFGMLETIREYAWERLLESGEAAEIRGRHARWCLELAERVALFLMSGARGSWLAPLEAEHDNLRAALDWSLTGAGKREVGLRQAGALAWFWYFRGYLSEARRRLAATTIRHLTDPPPLHALAVWTAGFMAWAQGDFDESMRSITDLLPDIEELPDPHWRAMALAGMGIALLNAGHPERALELFGKSIELGCTLAGPWPVAFALSLSSEALWLTGDLDTARAHIEESQALFDAIGDPWGHAVALKYRGFLAEYLGDYASAATYLAESAEGFRSTGDRLGAARAVLVQAYMKLQDERFDAARPLFAESLEMTRDLGQTVYILLSLAGCGMVAMVEGRDADAVRLFGRTAEIMEERRPIADSPVAVARASYARHVSELRTRLGEAPFAAGWTAGQAMPLEEAIALGFAVVSSKPS